MKILLFIFSLAIGMNVYSQLAISTNGSSPDNSAMLDVKSTGKVIRIPRITHAQCNIIVDAANGLLIYQTNNSPGFYYNSGTSGITIPKNSKEHYALSCEQFVIPLVKAVQEQQQQIADL